ncbi:MAG: DNA repair protein RadA [Pseudomonadota bacterium]|jgi:DNA repair protein RadA/Sms
MAKSRTTHVCSACGAQSTKWQGQCPGCAEWNTLVETVVAAHPSPGSAALAGAGPGAPGSARTVSPLATLAPHAEPRFPTGSGELDRVLGGGLTRASVVLIGGDPGIGKSTLLLQALAAIAADRKALYVTGEESLQQVALRARRLGVEGAPLGMLAETQVEAVLATLAAERPEVAVIDSIQTVWSEALASAPGSVAQVRECAAQFTRHAKAAGCALVMVGHVTKEGALAGPRVLEHMVDSVLYFEGETHSSYRLIRAFKNRFGAVNELGVFAMTERGLRDVANPSAMFLSQHGGDVPGSCVTVTLEGSRPLAVELQALVDEAQGGHPRRLTVGMDNQRLSLLLAVLHRHAGVSCADQDVFLNVVGGVRVAEPSADLPALLAIVSSLRARALPGRLVAFGEVGLAGEIRPVVRGVDRIREAAKLGFTRAIVPVANRPRQPIEGIEIVGVSRVEEALEAARG